MSTNILWVGSGGYRFWAVEGTKGTKRLEKTFFGVVGSLQFTGLQFGFKVQVTIRLDAGYMPCGIKLLRRIE